MHEDDRRPDDDFLVPLVPLVAKVSVPSAFLNQTSGGGEKGKGTGK